MVLSCLNIVRRQKWGCRRSYCAVGQIFCIGRKLTSIGPRITCQVYFKHILSCWYDCLFWPRQILLVTILFKHILIEEDLLDLYHLLIPKYFLLVFSVLAIEIFHIILFLTRLSCDCWRMKIIHYHGLYSLFITIIKYFVILLLVFV